MGTVRKVGRGTDSPGDARRGRMPRSRLSGSRNGLLPGAMRRDRSPSEAAAPPGCGRRPVDARGGRRMLPSMRRPASSWRRLRVAAVVLACVTLVGPLAGAAQADPSDQPGGTTAVFESDALDDLQTRAGEVQDRLKAQQGQVIEARRALNEAQADVDEAEAAVDDAEGRLSGYQDVVA